MLLVTVVEDGGMGWQQIVYRLFVAVNQRKTRCEEPKGKQSCTVVFLVPKVRRSRVQTRVKRAKE